MMKKKYIYPLPVTNLDKKSIQLKELINKFEDKALDLQRAQSLTRIGSWRYKIDEDILILSDETYNIFQIDKIKYPIKTLDDFFTKVDPAYIEVIKQEYEKHLKSGIPYDVTRELKLEDGTLKWIRERCESAYDNNGNPFVSNGTLQDITKDIEKKNSILVKEAQLLKHSRMAQMGEMISMIAHQWRQPLGAISSVSIDLGMKIELETFDLEQDKGRKECQTYFSDKIKEIDGLVRTLTTTIDDFRNFYKLDKKADFVMFHEPVKKSLDIIKASFASDGIEIVEKCIVCNKKSKMYSNEIMQVILNILKNSQDNFKEKKIIDPKITLACECASNGKIILKIYDNGGGIPEDIIDNIFTHHFSTKSENSGSGLGLYMSKIIIEEHHNGRLTVENIYDGACFIIELDGVLIRD